MHPPFGDYLAAPESTIARIHRTSGTTGTAMNLALSAEDAEETALVGARAQAASGLGPGHRVVHCLNYRLWMGGYTDHATLEATGAAVIPFGVGETQQLVRTILELEDHGDLLHARPIRRCWSGSSPSISPISGRATSASRSGSSAASPVWTIPISAAASKRPGASRRAMPTTASPMSSAIFAGQSELDNDLHFMALDVLHPELIDPATGAVLPWREGERGELVLTHVSRQCQPLVRFRTGDIILLTGTGPARCGRTAPRFRIVGRSDDMVVVRGINVFPAQIAAVINRNDALSGEYRIRARRPGAL